MPHVFHDIRLALRVLARNRFVSGLAILAFTLGIGVTAAVFSIFNAVLLKPLPYPDSGRIVMVYDTQPACATCPASFPKYHDWKTRSTSFSAVGGATPRSLTLTNAGTPEHIAGLRTTASLGAVLGVQPALGRWFRDDEDQPGAAKVVVLSHEFWQTRMAGRPGVLGEKLTLDGEPYEVIGVMPKDFTFRASLLYVPVAIALDQSTRGTH